MSDDVFQIGFTGTRNGMTPQQINTVTTLLAEAKLHEARSLLAHHGDCVGADATFDQLCAGLQIPRVAHPPDKNIHRAFCLAECVLMTKPYLQRNKDIVDASNTVIATPETHSERERSGTWSTVRYAKRTNTHLVVVYPCGDHETFHTPIYGRNSPWSGSSSQ